MPLAPLILILSIAFALSPLLVADFNGFDADQFPVPQIDPQVQPEGYAFAIWGVIYLWLITSAVIGLRRPDWAPMRPALAVSLAVGSGWLAVAVSSPVWASVLIWIMLGTALLALFRMPPRDGVWGTWPLGLYAGWLSAASCVSLGLLTAGYGILSADVAAYVFVIVASVLAFWVQRRMAYVPTYGVAVAWALFAVAVQNGLNTPIAFVAYAGIAGVAYAARHSLTRPAT